MSSTLIESPVSGSQLYFSWNESSESLPSGASQVGSRAPVVPGFHEEAVCQEAVRRRTAQTTPKPSSIVPAQAGCATTALEPTSDRLQFTAQGRVTGPVRIGAVMIKLLKRYGISEAEIAEGLARYAHQRRTAVAS